MGKSERESVIESIGESEKEREQLKTGCEKNWIIIKKIIKISGTIAAMSNLK